MHSLRPVAASYPRRRGALHVGHRPTHGHLQLRGDVE
jgi:hypothetical protein